MLSVIIPTLNAEKHISQLLDSIKGQKNNEGNLYGSELELIVIDSESCDSTLEIAQKKGARTVSISRKEFDHGGTRNIAWKQAKGDFVFFLSQDALPANSSYIYNFMKFFEIHREDLVMISGRQIPREEANPIEKLTRSFNYPEKSFIRDVSAVEEMGIKAYFFSDVCSVYRRSFLEKIGGFESPILTNEDMLMASRAMKKGYRVGYCAEAKVYHSHNFTLKQQYQRNFDVAAFLQMFQEEIDSSGCYGEGMKMVKYIELELLRQHHLGLMIRCILESAAKFLGSRAGRKYQTYTVDEICKKSSNPGYWKKHGV